MKILLSLFLYITFSFVSVTHGQNYKALEDQFVSSSILPNIHFGFSLYDLDSNKYVFGIKENQHFTPASNTKVFTLFSSLKNLGDSIPGIQYIERGDSLIFWGTGDPTFLHPKLDSRLVYDFLKNSKEKLFYVPQKSSEPAYRNGWSIEDYQESFQPDISTFPIYGNVVTFKADSSTVQVIPSYFQNNLYLQEEPFGKFDISRYQHENKFEQSQAVSPSNYTTSKPFIWSHSLFVKLLQDTLKRDVGVLKKYAKPDDVKVVFSVPRNVLLREMMLPSDNFLAEHLTMLISNTKYNGFYTDSLRKDMQREFYSKFQDSIVLRDGSGLSTYNKITPSSMIELLVALEELQPDDDKRFLFFPAGGIDGTIKSAYKLDLNEPFVWAKTGTINSVHCQSGYIITREGRRLAFSFLNNNYLVPTSDIRKEMVRIVTYIRQNY